MSIFQEIILKIQKQINKDQNNNKEIVETIAKIVKIPINNDQIIIKNKGIFLKTGPTTKMAILIKKEEILLSLKEQKIEIYSIS